MQITIIGGGISGCTAAFALARAGHAVTLLEAQTLGAGASGAALGGLFPYTDNITSKLAAVQRQSIAGWSSLAAQLAEASGTPIHTFFRNFATSNLGAKQINPATIFPVLRAALQAHGVTIQENTPVTELPQTNLLLAAGWGNKALSPEQTSDLHIKQGQAVLLHWPHALAAPLYGEELYILPGWQPDTVLVGSSKKRLEAQPEQTETPDPAVTEDILTRANKLLPGLAAAPIKHTWVGYRPTQTPILPLLRPHQIPTKHQQIHVVSGLGGMGYCLAPAVANAAVVAFS